MSTTYKFTQFGNSILRQTAERIHSSDIASSETQALIERMQSLLKNNDYGVGLSAPQLGISKAIVVIDLKPTPTVPDLQVFSAVLINPLITESSGEDKNMIEGCLSAGGSDDSICAKVPRPNSIRLQWADEMGIEHDQLFEGFVAHTIQHEVDHLNGILFVDRVKDTKTYILMGEYKKQHLDI